MPVARAARARAAGGGAARRRGRSTCASRNALPPTLGTLQAAASDDRRRDRRGADRPGADARGDARRRQRVGRRPDHAADLLRGRRACRARPAPAGVQGQIFAFVGAKGGVGTTTIAVNVATALAQAVEDERTLLMDLHLSYGDAAVFLGAEPRFSVADAMENTHRLDEAFFESLVVQTKSAACTCWPRPSGPSARVDLRRIAHAAAVRGDALPLHLPRRAALGSRGARRAGRRGDDPDRRQPGAGHGAQRRVASPPRCGSATARTASRSCISRFDKQAEIGHEDVERVVGSPVKYTVPSDYRAGPAGAQQGTADRARPDNKLTRRVPGDRFRSGRHAGRGDRSRRPKAAASSAG